MAAEHETFHHVRDFPHFELPFGKTFDLPEIPFLPSPSKLLLWANDKLPAGESVFGFQITKFMLLQVVAGLLALWIGTGLAKRVSGGRAVHGWFWNFWEALALFIRDEVVRPTIGTGHHGSGHGDSHTEDPHQHVKHGPGGPHHGEEHSLVEGAVHHGAHMVDDAHAELEHPENAGIEHRSDKYLPYVWSAFFYVLFCNLLGAVPLLGSATGEINVTGSLALCTFVFVIACGVQTSGAFGFVKSLAPSMDVPKIMKPFLFAMIWVIEAFGFLIKHAVLAVRLFANIMGGHTVLGVILGFIAQAAALGALYYLITPLSVFGQVAIGLLELLVAFLQAYIFAFLTSLFISAVVNPH